MCQSIRHWTSVQHLNRNGLLVESWSVEMDQLFYSLQGLTQVSALEPEIVGFLQGMFLTQGSNLVSVHCRQVLYRLSQQRGLIRVLLGSKWLIWCYFKLLGLGCTSEPVFLLPNSSLKEK